ncbi:uncharacterized protein LOC134788263 [Penaeus indicus]|uniref:uncharacterized protein LOC134788263 n=1 Tax=Penaeus indicus TaxID=29960 RepID=UPI00300C6ABC
MIHSKYYFIAFGLIVGTEILYRCVQYIVKQKTGKADTMQKRNYTKVIFFPDKGITSNGVYQGVKPVSISWQDLSPQMPMHRNNVMKNNDVPKQVIATEGKKSSLLQRDAKMEVDQMEVNGLEMEISDELPCEKMIENPFLVPKAFQEQVKNKMKHKNHLIISCNKENTLCSQENSSEESCSTNLSENPFGYPVQPGGNSFFNSYSEHKEREYKKYLNSFHIDGRQQTTRNVKNEQFISGVLRRSTSLVHMVNAILAAKKSVVICVYVFTCKVLADAVIKVKQRGVNVRVLVENQMINSSMEVIKLLQRHNILVWCSQSTFLMHHKFAVIDGPLQNETQGIREIEPLGFRTQTVKKREIFCLSGLTRKRVTNDQDGRRRSSSKVSKNVENGSSDWAEDGVLMNGSFNWTWGAVVGNNENVVITNEPELVWHFAGEFENMWKAAGAPTQNDVKIRK